MNTSRIESSRPVDLNPVKPAAAEPKTAFIKPAETPTPSTSRLGETNFAGLYLKNKLANFDGQAVSSVRALNAVAPTQTAATAPTRLNFEESKSVSDVAYEGKAGEVYQFPDGSYWRVDKAEEKDSGFRAVAMRKVVPDGSGGYMDDPNDNRVVIGFAGTNGLDDVDDDILQGIGMTPEQYSQALEFTRGVQQDAAKNCEAVNLTGHSLGGGLATYVSTRTGLPATAINSAPLADGNVPNGVNYDNQITQYYAKGEILTDLDNINPFDSRPGKQVEVGAATDEQGWVDSVPLWVKILSPNTVTAGRAAISIDNHMLGNTAPEVAAPTRVYP